MTSFSAKTDVSTQLHELLAEHRARALDDEDDYAAVHAALVKFVVSVQEANKPKCARCGAALSSKLYWQVNGLDICPNCHKEQFKGANNV